MWQQDPENSNLSGNQHTYILDNIFDNDSDYAVVITVPNYLEVNSMKKGKLFSDSMEEHMENAQVMLSSLRSLSIN